MSSAVDDPIEHKNCPWCQDNDALKVTRLENNNFAVWCSTCGAHGPEAPSREDAWDLWDER